MLKTRDLTLDRLFEPVFAPVNLEVKAGELWLLSGANGRGKTTLIRLLAGLLTPSTGTVALCSGVSYLGHQLGVKDDLTVAENLRFYSALAGTEPETVGAAIERLGLRGLEQQAARTLSAGQRKRCALARLLLHPQPLWLLDEPYANLDADGIDQVDELIREQLAQGGACVLSTHGALRPASLPYQELALQAPVYVP